MNVDALTLFCAVRYALGRRTYVVSGVARDVVTNARRFTAAMASSIVDEIEKAIAEDNAGARGDIAEWRRCVGVLRLAHGLPGADVPSLEVER